MSTSILHTPCQITTENRIASLDFFRHSRYKKPFFFVAALASRLARPYSVSLGVWSPDFYPHFFTPAISREQHNFSPVFVHFVAVFPGPFKEIISNRILEAKWPSAVPDTSAHKPQGGQGGGMVGNTMHTTVEREREAAGSWRNNTSTWLRWLAGTNVLVQRQSREGMGNEGAEDGRVRVLPHVPDTLQYTWTALLYPVLTSRVYYWQKKTVTPWAEAHNCE